MNLFFVLCGSLIQSSICAFTAITCTFVLMHLAQEVPCQLYPLLFTLFSILAIMPSTVAAISVSLFYSQQGICAVIFAHLLLNIPLTFYLLYFDFIRLNFSLYLTARCLGASRIRSYCDGVLTPLFPSLVRAFCTVFILCFSSTSIPLLLGKCSFSNTLDSFFILSNNSIVRVLCISLRVLVVFSVLCLSAKYSNELLYIHDKTISFSSNFSPQKRIRLSMFGVILLIMLVMPLLGLWYQFFSKCSILYCSYFFDIFNESLVFIVIRSVLVAMSGATIALLIALLFLYIESHCITVFSSIFWLTGGVVYASICSFFAFYIPWLSALLVVVCHSMLCFPFVVRIIIAAMNQYDKMWTLYARSCGATRWHIFSTLELPYLRGSLLSAWSLSCGFCLSQVGVAQLLRESIGITLPVAMRICKASGAIDGAVILSGLSMILTLVITFVAWRASSYFYYTKRSLRH